VLLLSGGMFRKIGCACVFLEIFFSSVRRDIRLRGSLFIFFFFFFLLGHCWATSPFFFGDVVVPDIPSPHFLFLSSRLCHSSLGAGSLVFLVRSGFDRSHLSRLLSSFRITRVFGSLSFFPYGTPISRSDPSSSPNFVSPNVALI